MRGLPPPPADFISIQAAWDIKNAAICTTSWWLFAPGADSASSFQLETLLGDFFLNAMPDLLSVLGDDVTCSALRCSSYGTDPSRVQYAPAPNVGALGGTVTLNAALVLTWRGNDRGRGVDGHTFLPLSTSLVDDNRRTLTSIAWSQCQAAARSFALHMNAITSPDGASCVFAVLHRSKSGFPLPATLWSPIDLGDASSRVGTLRRRIRSGEAFSLPF